MSKSVVQNPITGFLSLCWEDILFQNILPFLSIKDWFNLRFVSKECQLMVDEYFKTVRHVNLAHQRNFSPLAFKVSIIYDVQINSRNHLFKLCH
jgi:hypothetical protein